MAITAIKRRITAMTLKMTCCSVLSCAEFSNHLKLVSSVAYRGSCFKVQTEIHYLGLLKTDLVIVTITAM